MTGSDPKTRTTEDAALLATGLHLQQQGLALLLAEMQALARLMPGQATEPATEEETEAGFDNMPV